MIFKRIKSEGLAHIKGSYSIWLEGCTNSNSDLTVAMMSWYSMYVMRMSGKKDIQRALCIFMSGNSRAGYPNVCCDVLGSTRAWRASKYPMTKGQEMKVL
jgi:hypothetical protein